MFYIKYTVDTGICIEMYVSGHRHYISNAVNGAWRQTRLCSSKLTQMKVLTIIFLLSFPPVSWLLPSAPSSTCRYVLHYELLFYSFCSRRNCNRISLKPQTHHGIQLVREQLFLFWSQFSLSTWVIHSASYVFSRGAITSYFEVLKFQKQLAWLCSTYYIIKILHLHTSNRQIIFLWP